MKNSKVKIVQYFGATVRKGENLLCDDIITTLRNIAGGNTVQYFLCNLMLYFQDRAYGVFPVEWTMWGGLYNCNFLYYFVQLMTQKCMGRIQ